MPENETTTPDPLARERLGGPLVAELQRADANTRLDAMEKKVEALTMALAVCAPDSTTLVEALLKAPRSGWTAILTAYTLGRRRRGR
jgi:hypothetical protein